MSVQLDRPGIKTLRIHVEVDILNDDGSITRYEVDGEPAPDTTAIHLDPRWENSWTAAINSEVYAVGVAIDTVLVPLRDADGLLFKVHDVQGAAHPILMLQPADYAQYLPEEEDR
jgi:hypothetical protein